MAGDEGNSNTRSQRRKYTRDELLKGSRVNKIEWDAIEPDLWFTPISQTSDATHLTTSVARSIENYTSEQLCDDDLFYAFREEFEIWNKDMFDRVHLAFRRELKMFLRFHGVYTGRNNGRIGQQLADMLQMEEAPKWDEAELRNAKLDTESRAFEQQRALPHSSSKTQKEKLEPAAQDPQSDKPPPVAEKQPPSISPAPQRQLMQPPPPDTRTATRTVTWDHEQENVDQPVNWPISSSESPLPLKEEMTPPTRVASLPQPPQPSWSQMPYLAKPTPPTHDAYSTLPLFKSTTVCEQLFADIRISIETSLVNKQFASHLITKRDKFYLERRPLRRKKRKRSRWPSFSPSQRSHCRQRIHWSSSQRLFLALAPSLMKTGMTLSLRDITQAYPQAQTDLYRVVLADLPTELKQKYPENTIIRVIKPLYGIAEAGVHWFATYQGHHTSELDMSTSTFDPCLMISNHGPETFGMIGMQTDDTLILATPTFSTTEEEKIEKAQFRSKPKTFLSPETPLDFNGAKLTLEDEVVVLRQKGQGAKIDVIDTNATDRAQRYVEQRARGAYIASICQPEASFDVSVAAQAQNPDEADCATLNKRLKWQMDNLQRGLRYIPIDLTTAKLMVFTDGSFANNKDLSSQIGFVLMLVTETARTDKEFDIRGNLIHWSSTKCKRVTRSVLASEIYGMVNGFDIGLSIATTVRKITDRLLLPAIPLIVCTDSYSLYECLVKLGTTKEKRLMIDIMALRQSYERREIAEIRWINGKDNPSDAMTKASPNNALERFINDNELTIRMEGFVQRKME